MSKLEKKVLETVCRFGVMHPAELQEHFSTTRVVNAWGGYSKATTQALERLHYRGLLRIARRENGIRLYEPVRQSGEAMPLGERLRKLVMLIANILAPVSEKTLLTNTARFRYLGNPRPMLRELLKTGELEGAVIDGIHYVRPHSTRAVAAPRVVRFLAPFDPVVWDRRRFEHLWGWPYRFEAYTPAAKRLRGYYAMPLLWGEDIIGWANARTAGQALKVELGFANKRPVDSIFRQELDAEISRLQSFLNLSRMADAG